MVTRKPNIILRILRWLSMLTLLTGLAIIAEEILSLQGAHQIKGEVVGVEHEFSTGQRSYQPVIRYSDVHTPEYTTVMEQSSLDYNFPIGQVVVILFNPENPRDIRMNADFNAWMPGGQLALSGLFAFYILGFFTKPRRPKRRINSEAPMHAMGSRPEHLASPETAADHAREASYKPTVTRMR